MGLLYTISEAVNIPQLKKFADYSYLSKEFSISSISSKDRLLEDSEEELAADDAVC